jgi:hypothetical protein
MALASAAWAQEYRFAVEADKTTVTLGGVVTLTYRLEGGNPTEFKEPQAQGFDYASYVSQGMEMRQFGSRFTKAITFSVSIKPKQVGTLVVQPASVVVSGSRLESDKIVIQVTDKGQAEKDFYARIAQGLYIKVSLSKNTVYVGEQVRLTYTLYRNASTPIANLEYKTLPEYDGFWKEVLVDRQKFQLTDELINGERYQTGILESVILFPQKAGTFTLDPFVLHTRIPVPSRRRTNPFFFDFDDFFGSYNYLDYDIESPITKLTVNPLPQPQPSAFSGLVGKFSFTAALSAQQVEVDDAITLNATVTGTGNLRMLNPWRLQLPLGLEDYPNKTHDNVSTKSGVMQGNRRFEYLMFPRREGVFKLPELSLCFFDVETEKYITLSSGILSFQTGKSSEVVGTNAPTAGKGPVVKSDIAFINNDIQYIIPDLSRLYPLGYSPFLSSSHILWSSVPFIILVMAIWLYRRYGPGQQLGPAYGMRHALILAKKHLDQAQKHMVSGRENLFYDEVSKALATFLTQRLGLPAGEYSRDRVEQALQERGFTPPEAQAIGQVIDLCGFARFAPGTKALVMHDVFIQTSQAMAQIDQKLGA